MLLLSALKMSVRCRRALEFIYKCNNCIVSFYMNEASILKINFEHYSSNFTTKILSSGVDSINVLNEMLLLAAYEC